MRVEVETQAEWDFGLLQRKHRGNPKIQAELNAAYYGIITELRTGHPNIWLMLSEDFPDAYVCFHPPLHGHFRKIADDKVAIFSFRRTAGFCLP